MSEYITASSIVIASTFLLIPTLGEIFSERSGILNLGIEGMIITSAAGSFYFAYLTRDLGDNSFRILGGTTSVWIGIMVGILLGMILASIHALLTITLKRNQIVSGIGLTIFGTGLSGLLGKDVLGKSSQVDYLESVPIPILSDIPFFGEVFFNNDIIVYFSFGLVPILWFVLFKTKYGIIVRTVGENPSSAHNQGVDVNRVRFINVVFGGALAGLGGAYLSLAWLESWTEGMTNGRGWIVIALVIIAMWHPIIAFFGAYIFGTFWVYQFKFQGGITLFGITPTINGEPIDIPTPFIEMLPFISTLLFLMLGSAILNRSKVKQIIGAPSALTIPFQSD